MAPALWSGGLAAAAAVAMLVAPPFLTPAPKPVPMVTTVRPVVEVAPAEAPVASVLLAIFQSGESNSCVDWRVLTPTSTCGVNDLTSSELIRTALDGSCAEGAERDDLDGLLADGGAGLNEAARGDYDQARRWAGHVAFDAAQFGDRFVDLAVRAELDLEPCPFSGYCLNHAVDLFAGLLGAMVIGVCRLRRGIGAQVMHGQGLEQQSGGVRGAAQPRARDP